MIKYYDYISESKIDMILPQIPRESKEKVSIEMGINLQIFNAKIKTESEVGSLESKILKAKVVSEYIITNEKTSNVQTSVGDWIYEKDIPVYSITPNYFENMILFVSKLDEDSYLILSGSKSNVIGGKLNAEKTTSLYSYGPDVISHIDHMAETTFKGLETEFGKIYAEMTHTDIANTKFNDWAFGSCHDVAKSFVENSKYQPKRKSFLAKKFIKTTHMQMDAFGKEKKYELVIGSPIYIADREN